MTTRVMIAPDKFKGSLDARRAAAAMERGLLEACPDWTTDLCPLADGGEGTLDVLLQATGGTRFTDVVTGPLGAPTPADWGVLGDGRTAVIEMARASGLALLEASERNPLAATTFGTGELMARALDRGLRRFIVAVGGSATVDGGMGMAQALGAHFLDGSGRGLPPGGGSLERLASIHLNRLDPRVRESEILIACDVDNPLTGIAGAAAVYGPQKGASPDQVQTLDRGLARLAAAAVEAGLDDAGREAGAGAAGGLGFGLMAFTGARPANGARLVMESVGFQGRLRGCSLALTGEGKLDEQTARGKTVSAVAAACGEAGVPLVALAGQVEGDLSRMREAGLSAAFCILGGPMPLTEAMAGTERELARFCRELGFLLRSAMNDVNRP